ncbi:LytR C-terminal domain-containing protein [Actinoplanes sp. G11-F43]|uniref:LytR C-terminal domain-containing protein n=1 Tax=Actinoplanes sp. G11-F43 TaxID=3424130 RepID=UPI003D3490F8
MSRPVHERIRELETDVRNLEVAPAAAVRARGRQRARRQWAVASVAGAVVAVTAGVAVAWPGARPGGTAIAPAGPSAAPMIDCVVELPDSPADVRIRVLGGGAAEGRAAAVADELRTRRFSVVGDPAAGSPVKETELRYGPASVGMATLASALLPETPALRFEPERPDATVDLVLGPAFDRLATTTEINRNLVMAGNPAPPPGCR